MKTSIATILWGKLHGIDDFKAVLSQVKKFGYDGIGLETRFLPKEIRKNPELVPQLERDSKLENAGSYSSMSASDVDWAVKSKTPLLWVVVRREKIYREALRTLKKFSKIATDSSIIPALHNHLGTCFESEKEVVEVLEKMDGVRLCFDTAHAEAAKIDSVGFIRKYHDRIALVHLKDLRVRVPKNRVSFTKDFVNIGSGVIDFGVIIEALREVKYRGHLMLEIDAAKGKQSPAELASEGHERLSRLLDAKAR